MIDDKDILKMKPEEFLKFFKLNLWLAFITGIILATITIKLFNL